MIEKHLLKYHHLGIPTTEERAGEVYRPELQYSVYQGTNNDYGVEWVRFDDGADYPDMLKEYAHVTFEVDSLEEAIEGEELLVAPRQEAPGVRSAYITLLEAPVKFVEIDYAIADDSEKNPVVKSGKNLKYHHTGMPCDKTFENEEKRPALKLAYLPGKLNNYGVEWLRFYEGNENPDIIKYIPHVAFEVEDIDQAIVGEKVIYHSGRSYPGIVVAMVEVDGASIEFLELDRSIVGDEFDA
ncbi:hypothetical protein AADZ91_13060 [Colwelliaceae bacterium 6441]